MVSSSLHVPSFARVVPSLIDRVSSTAHLFHHRVDAIAILHVKIFRRLIRANALTVD